MCGIIGLFLKNPELRPQLGHHVTTMLMGMSERGPDSAGLAIYHRPVAAAESKLTIFSPDPDPAWNRLSDELSKALGGKVELDPRGNHAVLVMAKPEAEIRAWLARHRSDIRVMGYGQLMEVYKDMGRPAEVMERYGVATMGGSHAIGHTRMATESAVTTEHSHPFTAAADMCLVHNGSLSNHNNLRRWLRHRGFAFETDNDSEVAARYFAYRLGEGASLAEALEAGLSDLDGFYTFTMGTRDGFAVVRDGIACKPAVLAETDDWVAMASEFRSLANLPGVERAAIWEPEPGRVYTWNLQ